MIPAPVASARSRVIALDGTPGREGPHAVAVEVPVRLSFADVPFAVMMLSPSVISLPLKVLFFVLIDGWNMLVGSLIRSYS